MTMNSSRPYIIQALYDWILDNECTPYILVNAYQAGVEVPQEHVKDGQIILNISPMAVKALQIGKDEICFDGRFAGIPKQVRVPVRGVLGIYAKENGQGMIFDTEGDGETPAPKPTRKTVQDKPVSSPKKKPSLRVVK
ncbi:MAG: ClpXP protease specificity-enhancing factor [Gammaproteobacteria bacterium]